MRDLMFLSVILAMVPLSLRFPMVGVLGWAWTALLAPNDWLFSYMAEVPFNKVFAGATVLGMLVNAQQVRLRMSPTVWLLGSLLAIGTISAVFGIDQGAPSWNLYWKFTKIVAFAFVIGAVVRTRLDLHALLLAVALGVGFVGVSEGAFYIASGGGHVIKGNASVGDNNSMAVGLLIMLPVILYLSKQSQVRAISLVGYLAAILDLVAVIGTYSRGALIGLLALGMYMLSMSRRKVLGFVLAVIVGAGIMVAAPERWSDRMDTISDANKDGSFLGRVIAWKISTAMAFDRPAFGGGFHAVQHPFAWSFYKRYIDIFDFVPTPPPDINPHAAHSIYFEILGDLGFTGVFVYFGLIFIMYRNTRAVRLMCRGVPNLLWAYDLAIALQASIVVFLVAGAGVSVAYSDLIFILIMSAEALKQIVAEALPAAEALKYGVQRPAAERRQALILGRPGA